MEALSDFLVPIFVAVILPIAIVWIVGKTRQNEVNRKTEVMLKAIENGQPVDANMFKTEHKKKQQTVKSQLLDRLTGACVTSLLGIAFIIIAVLRCDNLKESASGFMFISGCILLAIGIALFIIYFIGKNMLAKEIEDEENRLGENK